MLDAAATTAPAGKVAFVGAGPGDPDLLTLRAHRLLLAADVVVHDNGTTEAMLAMARRDVERVRLDRRPGAAMRGRCWRGSAGRAGWWCD